MQYFIYSHCCIILSGIGCFLVQLHSCLHRRQHALEWLLSIYRTRRNLLWLELCVTRCRCPTTILLLILFSAVNAILFSSPLMADRTQASCVQSCYSGDTSNETAVSSSSSRLHHVVGALHGHDPVYGLPDQRGELPRRHLAATSSCVPSTASPSHPLSSHPRNSNNGHINLVLCR